MRMLRTSFTLVLLALLPGCVGPLSTLDPAGPSASAIATLWWVMFWGSVVLFVLVIGLLALAWWKPVTGARVTPMRWVIYGGLVMPAIVLTALVTYALIIGERLLPHASDQPTRVSAHGVMWQWQFAYPDIEGAGTTTTILHIPAGEPVDVEVTSADVIHSFWVPRLAGKIDAIPGHTNTIRIQADRPGSYQGVCAEFCGMGHTEMLFRIEAHAPEDFVAAVQEAAL